MRRIIYPLFCLFFLVNGLVACTSDQLPLSSVIDVQITPAGCHPMQWRAPAGQVISLKLSNKAAKDYTWIFMGRPVDATF